MSKAIMDASGAAGSGSEGSWRGSIQGSQAIKVAVFSGSIPSTTFIERLIAGLAESGVQVILHGKINGAARYDSKNVRKIGYAGAPGRLWLACKFGVFFMLARPRTLLKMLRYRPERKISTGSLYWFAKVAPIVWYEPHVFHLQWTKRIEEWIFLQEMGTKVVVSLRGFQVNCSPIADERLARTYKRLFPLVDAFHGVSVAICREAAKFGASPDLCRVVYSGIKPEKFRFAEVKQFNHECIEIISVGRPHWKKGHHFALDAMKLLKDRGVRFHYRIVGGISEELVFQIADLGLEDSVTVEGSVPIEGVMSSVERSDIVLLSSVEEGIPNVILEAMAMGTIVVSTDCGGVSEVVTDGVNGFIVPMRDPEAIAEKIQTVAALCDCELDLIRRRARGTIVRHHDRRRMVSEMIELYQSTLQTN